MLARRVAVGAAVSSVAAVATRSAPVAAVASFTAGLPSDSTVSPSILADALLSSTSVSRDASCLSATHVPVGLRSSHRGESPP